MRRPIGTLDNLLIRFVAQAVLAVTWVIVWHQILYAGERPGEGFTASILTLLVVTLQYIIIGRKRAAKRLPPVLFARALTAGLAILLALMLLPMLAGRQLLTVFKLPLPGYTLSSTTIFDVALFFVVTGSMLLAFTRLEEPG